MFNLGHVSLVVGALLAGCAAQGDEPSSASPGGGKADGDTASRFSHCEAAAEAAFAESDDMEAIKADLIGCLAAANDAVVPRIEALLSEVASPVANTSAQRMSGFRGAGANLCDQLALVRDGAIFTPALAGLLCDERTERHLGFLVDNYIPGQGIPDQEMFGAQALWPCTDAFEAALTDESTEAEVIAATDTLTTCMRDTIRSYELASRIAAHDSTRPVETVQLDLTNALDAMFDEVDAFCEVLGAASGDRPEPSAAFLEADCRAAGSRQVNVQVHLLSS